MRMNFLKHKSYSFHLVKGCNGKGCFCKNYRTALVSGIWKDFWDGLQHTKIFITNDQAYTSKLALFQSYKERTAFTIPFHALSSTKDFTAAILADTDCNQGGNILDLTAPAAFQVNTIHINIRIVPGKRMGTPSICS